jgi:hypothetical protein
MEILMMSKNKIINLKEYKQEQQIKRQLKELDQIGEEQYHLMSPIDQTGYRNFMKLLKAVDEKYSKKD